MLYSPALANPFEGDNAHFLRIDDVNQALIELETQEETAGDTRGASLVYAGYPYDPYA
jgi:hypothetical protein